jgi:uncharacterized repeat protein (TIGR01451 family)
MRVDTRLPAAGLFFAAAPTLRFPHPIARTSEGDWRSWLVRGIIAAWCALAAGTAACAAADEAVTVALPKVAPSEFTGDLSRLPSLPAGAAARAGERPYRPLLRPPTPATKAELPGSIEDKQAAAPDATQAAMPAASVNIEGIARLDTCTGGQCGNGTPPDTNGEVGANHYIQAVNQAYGIYNKSGTLLASFTEDQLWAGDPTICNGQSFGDPIVVYDALADRWILTHFAFQLSGNNTIPPYYQCIAVSKTSDPVAGGWWRYPVRTDDASHPWLNDYAKFGIWTDCLYMSANEFTGAGAFAGTLFASFSRADMYAGLPLTASIGFITNTTNPFSMLPSHLGGQAGASVPAGTPNYFVSESQTAFAFEVRKFTAGPNCGAGGTLSSAVSVSQTSYNLWADPFVPQPGTTIKLDAVGDRLMQKAQYRKIGAVESLWVVHSFRNGSAGTARLGLQWAQINVTGGTISTTALQQQKYAPDATLYRFMPSIAVDGQGNMAIGYSTSGTTAPDYPGIAYSGRLASDPANTLPQTETFLVAGGSSQTGNCGGAPCDRWGDYSAMSLDPVDDCTFWITNEYYPGPFNANTIAWHTRIGAFKFPACTATARTADLAVTISDGATSVAPGAPISYTIVVTNNGPFAVTGASVATTIPASITGVSWTCVASPGNSCPASGNNSISTSAVNLLPGGTATFTLDGAVTASPASPVVTSVVVNAPAGITDPVPGNNSASDSDTVNGTLAPPTIAKNFGTSPIVVGQGVLLTIGITNANAGAGLTGIAFTDSLPAGVTAANASTSACGGGTLTISSNVITLAGGTLAASGNCSLPITVAGAQAQAQPWTNTISSVTSNEAGTNSTPATATITVNKATVATPVTSSVPNPTVVGESYTVNFSVSVAAPGAGTPTGTVTVSDGTSQCIATLPATSCPLTSVTPGALVLTAFYNGNSNFTGGISIGQQHIVNKGGTTTSITSDTPDPSVVGQPYAVNYSVAVTAPAAGTLTGTVTVSDGTAQCTGTLPATSCNLTSTTAGAKSLTATYNGNASFNSSTSASAAHQVNPAATTTAIVSDAPDPTVVGQKYTVTYAIGVTLPGAGTPTGSVTVTDGTDQCIGTLPATSCELTSNTAGLKMLVATYAGDAKFAGSTSPSASHRVLAPTSTAIVSDTPDPSVVGTAVSVVASVASVPPGGTPTGTITVSDGIDLCTITLPATACNWTPSTLGTRMLVATYNGDSTFAGSTSAASAHAVVPAGAQSTLTVTRAGSGSGQVTSNDAAISCPGTCAHAYLNGTVVGLTATPDPQFVFTGWLGPCTGTGTCSVTLTANTSVSATFAPAAIGIRTLDIDNDGNYDALTDGLMGLRFLFGLSGPALTNAATAPGAPRSTPDAVLAYLKDIRPRLDIDGNGDADALTDGVMIIRFLFKITGQPLISNAIGPNATRASEPLITPYLQSLTPPPPP